MKASVIFVLCCVSVGSIYSQLTPDIPDVTPQTLLECLSNYKCIGCFAPVCGLVVSNTTNASGYWCFGNQECYDGFNVTCGQHGVLSASPANMSSCSGPESTCTAKQLTLQCNATTTTPPY